ncbi:hypothetical protein HYU16_01280 [Candidatus Woesearchaeota archaeon]|nr:hypothetical protein [Candidatus Woesearchaeota archaeon]
MSTYGKTEGTGEVKKMGLGAMVVRTAMVTVAGGLLYTAVLNPVINWARNGNAPIEQGFVNYKSLDSQGKKNASGNMEAYLRYKHGDKIDSLPCMEGYSGGVVCGTVEYIVENFTPAQREGVVVEQFQGISNEAKRGIIGGELQAMLDQFYGLQNSSSQGIPRLQQQQQQYKDADVPKQK